MRPGYLGDLGDLGTPQVAAAAIVTGAAKVTINAITAVKAEKLNQKFQKQFLNDEQKLDYIRNIVLRYKGIGSRIVATTNLRPGTPAFEKELQKRLIEIMVYRGNCNADIFVPMGPKDSPGQPRELVGKFSRGGYMTPGSQQFPAEAGVVWSSGCKNAHDEFRVKYLDSVKGQGRFKYLKANIENIGVTGLFLRFGLGIMMLTALMLALRSQKQVVALERSRP